MIKVWKACVLASIISSCDVGPTRDNRENRVELIAEVTSPEPAGPALAPSPEPAQDNLQTPVLNRTSVVILNGSRVPKLSNWLQFDPRDAILKKVLDTMKRYAGPDIRFYETELREGMQLICVESEAHKADSIGSLWGRLATRRETGCGQLGLPLPVAPALAKSISQ